MKGFLEILASALEYAELLMRPGDEDLIQRLNNHRRFSCKCTNTHGKANVLLQAHFSRQLVHGNLGLDQREVLIYVSKLLQAMVDA